MAQRRRYLVVVAGGSGTRMGGSTPKQFLRMGGKSILRKFDTLLPDKKV